MPPKRKRTTDSGSSRPPPHLRDQTNHGQNDRNPGRSGGRNTRRNDRRDSQSTQGAPSTSNASQPPSPSTQRALPSPAPPPSPSKPAPTAAPTTMAPPPILSLPIPAENYYEIITAPRLASWKESGRQEVLDHAVQSRSDEDTVELSAIYQELAHSVHERRLDPVDAGSIVGVIVSDRETDAPMDGFSFDPRYIFIHMMSTLFEMGVLPVTEQFKSFLEHSDVSHTLMRQMFDSEFLIKLGLVRETFTRQMIRQNTNLLYRQQSYNLLREETEGFSKLMTELYNSITAAGNDPSFEDVNAAFERVKSLIGTFDLDTGRVLDITIDAFASLVIKHHKFIVKFMRLSSWWPRSPSVIDDDVFVGGLPRWAEPQLAAKLLEEGPDDDPDTGKRLQRDVAFWDKARTKLIDAFFELGGREVAESRLLELTAKVEIPEDNAELQWLHSTKTLPPSGNKTAAQILGFKLRFYSGDKRSKTDDLPANMLYLAALLIKIGFISLVDLYPHLYPFDKDMEAVREKRMKDIAEKEKASRPGASSNALLMAGALSDDTVTATTSRRDANSTRAGTTKASDEPADKDVSDLGEPRDQKVGLLRNLLAIGCIPESLYILGRFPWLPEAYLHTDDDLSLNLFPVIHRIILHSISKVVSESRVSSSSDPNPSAKKVADTDQSGVARGSVKLFEPQAKRPLRWPHPDTQDDGSGQSFRYYINEWVDNVPVCQTVDDVFTLCGTFMNVSGVNIGREPKLLQSLCSIGIKSLREDSSQTNLDRWQDLLKRLLVPALSLAPSNVPCVESVWSLLQLYPIPVRYNIYAEWYEGSVSRLPAIKNAFNQTRLDTLSTMKRLSKENISAMARTLAKTSHSSPGIVFRVALDQIESYSNLIQVFIECAKFFTDLGYDVLVWALMSSMGGKQRSRTQKDSVLLTSQWLQALSKFSGQVFKRYANMNPTPVLQYVNHQLLNGNSTDLVIFKELIGSMGGLVSNLDFTDAQNEAMSGFEQLRKQTLINLGDNRYESTKSGKRLMQALVDAKMVAQLLINIAQYRQNAIHQEDDAHVKFIATTLDDTHQILIMYLDFLRSRLDVETFGNLVPSVSQLMTEFGLEPNLAFMIGRFVIADQIAKSRLATAISASETSTTKSPAQRPVDDGGDVVMEGTNPTPVETVTDEMKLDDNKDATAMVSAESPAATSGRKNDQILDALQPIIDTVQTSLPEYIWQFIAPEFFALFWALDLGDLGFPQAHYKAESARLESKGKEIMMNRSDMSRAGMNKKLEERTRLLNLAKSFETEMLNHAQRNSKTKIILKKSAPIWFPAAQTDLDGICDMLLEQCILPRLLVSANDADYCFRMIKFLHDHKVPNFKLMTFYERFFNPNRLRQLIFTCTVREAEYLARFIKSILGDLSRWHRSKPTYEKEGFTKSVGGNGTPREVVDHGEFRTTLYLWHLHLKNALDKCLGDLEWMHIRNAITVIKTVMEFFPAVNFHGDSLLKHLETITKREAASKTASDSEPGHRVDLSVAAQTTLAQLQRRKSKWVMVQAFRPQASVNTAPPPTQKTEPNINTKQTDKPADTPKPAATAASVPPSSSASKSQQSNNAKTAPSGEVEDGELKDAKDRAAKSASQPATTNRSQTPIPAKPTEPSNDSQKKDVAAKTPASLPQAPAVPQKPSTSKQVPTSSAKTEPSKNSTLTSVPPSHSLPSRPDVSVPGHRGSDRRSRQDLPPREPQDTREPPRERPRDSRDYRERDYNRERDLRDGRDSMRTPENHRPGPRDSGRLPDWPPRQDGPPRRSDPDPRRNDLERDPRSHRDRGTPGDRGHDSRPSREHARDVAPTPVAPSAPAKDGPAASINPARAQLIAADKPELINPERAAMLAAAENRPPTVDRPSNRNHSPRGTGRRSMDTRMDARMETPTNPRDRDDRHGRDTRDGRGHHTDPRPSREDRNREAFHPSSRQSAHDARQQDPNYGRLNPTPSTPDIPSGPRGRGGPGGSNRDGGRSSNAPNGPSGRTDSRFPEPQRAPSPERQVPTGPSSSRPPRRGQQPATPVQPSPSTGVHPDRLRQIDANAMPAPPTPSAQPSQSAAPANAPSRPGRHGQSSSQQQSPHPGPKPSVPPLNTSEHAPASAPTGPHSTRTPSGTQQNTPSSDHRNPHTTPTGPSSSHNSNSRGPNRLFKNLQDTIGGGGRGRGSRHISGSDAQVLAGGDSANTTPVQERMDPMRRDAGSDRPASRDHGAQAPRDSRGANGDDSQASGARDVERSGRRDHRSDRSGRSRRSSRDRGERERERERSPGRGERDKGNREYRERRDAPAPGGSGRDSDRRSGRGDTTSANMSSANQEPLGGPPRDGPPRDPNRGDSNRGDPNREPLGAGRDSRHRQDGRTEDYGRGGRGGRDNGPRDSGARDGGARDSGRPGGDDRRDTRDDRGGSGGSRKRRSEGDPGGNDREKRPRR